jgi:hypothetical protein
MKCPNCDHHSDNSALVKCSHCGEAFERELLEELEQLEYLQKWVDKYRPEIGDKAQFIQSRVGEQYRKLLREIKGVAEAPKAASVPLVRQEPSPAPKPVIPEVKPIIEKPTPVRMQAKATSVSTLPPAPKPACAAPVVPSPKPAPRKPAAPPRPPRPPIDWRKVIVEAATSGALLRALLYLGAFMIVVSAAVLVIRFWNQFHPIIQLLFIASVPLTFYLGGWVLRRRLNLIQAGTVLTGIGALLVVVDFGAIYQLGGVGQNNGWLYWLVVSVFCTLLYSFTTWQLRGEFFNYLPLISGTSVLFTFTRVLNLPIEWTVVSVTISGVGMTLLASTKGGDRWREFTRASRYVSQILIPASLFYIVFSPNMPPVGPLMGFLFATLGYFILAWQFPAMIFAYAALGASMGTALFALRVIDLPWEWAPTAAAVLALVYILISQRLQSAKIKNKVIQNQAAQAGGVVGGRRRPVRNQRGLCGRRDGAYQRTRHSACQGQRQWRCLRTGTSHRCIRRPLGGDPDQCLAQAWRQAWRSQFVHWRRRSHGHRCRAGLIRFRSGKNAKPLCLRDIPP